MSRNLGETPQNPSQPETPDDLYERVTKLWQQELPDSFTLREKPYQTKQEMFEQLDARFAKELAQAATTPTLGRIKEGHKQATNNFYLWFSPGWAEEAVEGKAFGGLPYKFRPFYINKRFNNAWSRMCQELPEEVKTVVAYITAKQRGESLRSTDTVNNSLNKIALWFHDEEGIPPWFLCS